MSTYIYAEGCGYRSDPFQAETDEAAEAHVLGTFRSEGNPDFDGDEATLFRLDRDEEDGEFFEAGVCSFPGENMIEDPSGQRNPGGW